MLTALFFVLQAHAGELKIQNADAVAFRKLMHACEPKEDKCAGFKCKMSVTKMKCERETSQIKGTCTFSCNGSNHMLTDDQVESVFKAVAGQKKMIQAKDGLESFQDASISCDPFKGENTGVCKFKHAKIK